MTASQFLTQLEVASRRWEAMARAFCEKRGIPFHGDPARPIIDAVRANGGRADERLSRLVLGAREARP